MNKKVRWGIYILIGAGLIALGIYRFSPKKSKDQQENVANRGRQGGGRRVLNVNAIVIKEQNMVDDYRVTGRLIPDEEVDLSFETTGLVTDIFFHEGSHVKKGQLLAKVNDAPLQAQLMKLEAQLKLAEDRVFRQSALLEKDAVSKEAYEQVRTDLESLHADIQLVKANIDLTELRAPFDGIIGLRQISEGAYASPSIVVAKLTKTSPIKIEFSIPEKYSSDINVGTKVTFDLERNPNTYFGSIYAIESIIHPSTNSLTARAIHPNLNGVLAPGRTANITIRMLDIQDAIAIPTESLVPEMGVDKVFLYKSGKAQPITVTRGLRTDTQVQILDGLHIGDTLIVSGTLQLRTGLDVTLDNIN